MKQFSEAEIKKLINDEFKRLFKEELIKHIKIALKSRPAKEELADVIKEALTNLYWFMWSKKNMWRNEIKAK